MKIQPCSCGAVPHNGLNEVNFSGRCFDNLVIRMRILQLIQTPTPTATSTSPVLHYIYEYSSPLRFYAYLHSNFNATNLYPTMGYPRTGSSPMNSGGGLQLVGFQRRRY
jgi:hypothetical protein